MNDSYKKETEIMIEQNQIKEIQQILKNANFNPGSIDGVMGNKTKQAIREFQKAKGLEPTGKIDPKTQLALDKEKSQQTPSKVIEKTTKDLTTSKEGSTKEKKDTQNEVMSYRLQSKNRMEQIQTALTRAGLYNGEIDGKMGEQTKQAIKGFQKSKGLASDGVVGPKTWEELNKYLTD